MTILGGTCRELVSREYFFLSPVRTRCTPGLSKRRSPHAQAHSSGGGARRRCHDRSGRLRRRQRRQRLDQRRGPGADGLDHEGDQPRRDRLLRQGVGRLRRGDRREGHHRGDPVGRRPRPLRHLDRRRHHPGHRRDRHHLDRRVRRRRRAPPARRVRRRRGRPARRPRRGPRRRRNLRGRALRHAVVRGCPLHRLPHRRLRGARSRGSEDLGRHRRRGRGHQGRQARHAALPRRR